MTLEELAGRLDGVRRSGRGFLARCPAHEDKSPSLSVKDGERGLLVKCFAGCTAEAIVEALGLSLADLFDGPLPDRRTRARIARRPRLDRTAIAFQFRLHGDLLFLRGHAVLEAATGIDVAAWTDEDLDCALGAISKAYADLERADLLDDVAFNLRCRDLSEGAHAA